MSMSASPEESKQPNPDQESFVCVNCMTAVDTLYTQYSKDVIRVTDCSQCGNVADKYVEYDSVLLFNDVFLQYTTAYRHILLNTAFASYARFGLLFVLSNAYNKWVERRATLPVDEVYNLEWSFYEALLQSAVECFVFVSVCYGFSRLVSPKGTNVPTYSFYAKRAVAGFFGNVFVVFSIIWKLHEHLSYRIMTKLFIFVSQYQVQRTLFYELSNGTNFIAVVVSVILRLILAHGLQALQEYINVVWFNR